MKTQPLMTRINKLIKYVKEMRHIYWDEDFNRELFLILRTKVENLDLFDTSHKFYEGLRIVTDYDYLWYFESKVADFNSYKLLRNTLEHSGLPIEPEYKFHKKRKWRADFAIVEHKILIEVEGGMWKGGHTGNRYKTDIEKYNTATLHGWRLFRITREDAYTLSKLENLRDCIFKLINNYVEEEDEFGRTNK